MTDKLLREQAHRLPLVEQARRGFLPDQLTPADIGFLAFAETSDAQRCEWLCAAFERVVINAICVGELGAETRQIQPVLGFDYLKWGVPAVSREKATHWVSKQQCKDWLLKSGYMPERGSLLRLWWPDLAEADEKLSKKRRGGGLASGETRRAAKGAKDKALEAFVNAGVAMVKSERCTASEAARRMEGQADFRAAALKVDLRLGKSAETWLRKQIGKGIKPVKT